jgi:hypothetical protein
MSDSPENKSQKPDPTDLMRSEVSFACRMALAQLMATVMTIVHGVEDHAYQDVQRRLTEALDRVTGNRPDGTIVTIGQARLYIRAWLAIMLEELDRE